MGTNRRAAEAEGTLLIRSMPARGVRHKMPTSRLSSKPPPTRSRAAPLADVGLSDFVAGRGRVEENDVRQVFVREIFLGAHFGAIERQSTLAVSRMVLYFRKLYDDLSMARQRAATLESPNPEDDDFIKLAIVGYCYSQAIESWGSDEWEFVTQRRTDVEDFDPLWIEFVCLASGFLLGLFQAGKLNEAECFLFEAQLPGFMWQHSECFTTTRE